MNGRNWHMRNPHTRYTLTFENRGEKHITFEFVKFEILGEEEGPPIEGPPSEGVKGGRENMRNRASRIGPNCIATQACHQGQRVPPGQRELVSNSFQTLTPHGLSFAQCISLFRPLAHVGSIHVGPGDVVRFSA
eukprot:1180587-Prorocentrum_minimum.AAC.4